ncbi:MAG: transposase [Clostridia bacterium]|nr:transposase [Clostridia bacterium]
MIVKEESTRRVKGKTEKTVLPQKMQRSHWSIENSLHWSLDVKFAEDSAHVRLGNAAVVLNTFRKLVTQLLKADTSFKVSVQSKLLRCAWDFNYALSVLSDCTFPAGLGPGAGP